MAKEKGVMYNFRYPIEPTELFLDTCGFDAQGPNYRIDRTDFHGYGIEYVTRGRGYFKDASGEQTLTAGMVFCYSRGIPHSYWSSYEQPLEKYWIAFKGSDAATLLRESCSTLSGAVHLREPAEICAMFESVIREAVGRSSFTEQICACYLRVLFYKIRTHEIQRPSTGTGALNVFRACREYIDGNYEMMRTPFDAARHKGISSAHLCHIFKRFCNVSPRQYLTSLKMSRAATWLVSTDQPIKQISHDLSFKDQYTFSRAFKGHFGVSPTQYRQTQ